MTALAFLILIIAFACPICAAIVAGTKGRDVIGGFVLGLIFGPFGLLAICGMPARESDQALRARRGNRSSMKICPYCDEAVREAATVCRHCTSIIPDS